VSIPSSHLLVVVFVHLLCITESIIGLSTFWLYLNWSF
jgi:hypothetical protein